MRVEMPGGIWCRVECSKILGYRSEAVAKRGAEPGQGGEIIMGSAGRNHKRMTGGSKPIVCRNVEVVIVKES